MCQDYKMASQTKTVYATSLTIRSVKNGFIIDDNSHHGYGTLIGYADSNQSVFRTWEEVTSFITNFNPQPTKETTNG